MSNLSKLNAQTPANAPTCLSDVFLLCVQCHQPIKARINTAQWLRVEWIGPSGECLACYQGKKERDGKSEKD